MNKATKEIKNRILLYSALVSMSTLAINHSSELLAEPTVVANASQTPGQLVPVNHPSEPKKPCPKTPNRAENDNYLKGSGGIYRWLVGDHKVPSFHFIDVLELFK